MMSSGLVNHLTRVLGASGAREFVDDCSFFESSAGAAGSVDIIGSAIPKEIDEEDEEEAGLHLAFRRLLAAICWCGKIDSVPGLVVFLVFGLICGKELEEGKVTSTSSVSYGPGSEITS